MKSIVEKNTSEARTVELKLHSFHGSPFCHKNRHNSLFVNRNFNTIMFPLLSQYDADLNSSALKEVLEAKEFRTESDLLGEIKVPKDAYYGVQSLRGLYNYNITGVRLSSYRNFIKAFGMIKKACIIANGRPGLDQQGDRGRRVRCLRRRDRGQAGQLLHRGHDPGWCGYLHEHERERGDREPRSGDPGQEQGRVHDREPERPHQQVPVDERHVPELGPSWACTWTTSSWWRSWRS